MSPVAGDGKNCALVMSLGVGGSTDATVNVAVGAPAGGSTEVTLPSAPATYQVLFAEEVGTQMVPTVAPSFWPIRISWPTVSSSHTPWRTQSALPYLTQNVTLAGTEGVVRTAPSPMTVCRPCVAGS